MPVQSKAKTVLGEVEAEIAPVATEIVEKLKEEAPVVAKEAEHEAGEALAGKETPAAAAEHVAEDAEAALKTAAEGTTTLEKVTAAIETAEHVALETAAHVAEDHFPALTPYIEDLEPEIETRVFVITNLITSDFAHLMDTYVVELEASVVEKLHDTALKAVIEAKVLKDKGIRLLSNALSYIEVTKAKFLPHHPEN